MSFILHCVHQCSKTVHMAGHKKIKATVTSWHRGCSHIPKTFGISTPFYNRITGTRWKSLTIQNLDETSMHKQTMSRQQCHVMRQTCASAHSLHLSFWTIIEHVLTNYLYPSPHLDPFTIIYMIQIQHGIFILHYLTFCIWSNDLAYNWHPCISIPWLMFYSMLFATNLARKCKTKSCSMIFLCVFYLPKTCKQFIIRRHE